MFEGQGRNVLENLRVEEGIEQLLMYTKSGTGSGNCVFTFSKRQDTGRGHESRERQSSI